MCEESIPKSVLAAWSLEGARASRVASGWINQTYRLDEPGGRRFILQRLSSIFAPEVNLDIEAITARLAEAGVETPLLLRGEGGQLWIEDQGAIWRLMTFVEGETLMRADSSARCHSGARLLGRFHRALWDFDYRFRHHRLGVHDTAKHLGKLGEVLRTHDAHARHQDVKPLGEAILEASSDLPLHDALPRHIVHGDPKIANLLFGDDGEARCLVDLDTVAEMPLAVELGDALRSWCAPRGEENVGEVNLDFYRATLEGYAESMGELLPAAERDPIPLTTELIAVELAARFCADALEESYFAWDRERYDSACAHNLARAAAQLALARSLRAERTRIGALMRNIWPARP